MWKHINSRHYLLSYHSAIYNLPLLIISLKIIIFYFNILMIDKHYLCDEVFFTLNSYKIFEARIDVLKV